MAGEEKITTKNFMVTYEGERVPVGSIDTGTGRMYEVTSFSGQRMSIPGELLAGEVVRRHGLENQKANWPADGTVKVRYVGERAHPLPMGYLLDGLGTTVGDPDVDSFVFGNERKEAAA